MTAFAKKRAKSRSGTSRTQEQRKAGGRPNVTFALPTETSERVSELAERLQLSRSQVVAKAIDDLFANVVGA